MIKTFLAGYDIQTQAELELQLMIWISENVSLKIRNYKMSLPFAAKTQKKT